MKSETPAAAKAPPRRWRRWLKRSLWTLLGLLLLLVLFHRPLLRLAVQRGVPAFSKDAGMTITWDVGGTITGGIDITGVKVTGNSEAPIQSLTANRIRANYSAWDFVRKGLGPFLGGAEAELDAVDLVLDTTKFPPPKEEVKEPAPPPAIQLPVLKLKNVNARIILADGEVNLKGLNFTLQPGTGGVLEFLDLQLPGKLPRLQNVKGVTAAELKKLSVRDLQLLPGLKVNELTVDLKDLDSSRLAFLAALTVPGGVETDSVAAGPGNQRVVTGSGAVQISGSLDGIGKTPLLKADLTLTNLTPATLQPWVSLPPDLRWNVPEIKAYVNGDPASPRALSTVLTASIGTVTYQDFQATSAALDLVLEKGTVTLRKLDIAAGGGHVTATANGLLPEKWNGFDAFGLSASADISVPQVESIFLKNPPATGALNGKLNATLTNGSLAAAQATLRASGMAVQGVKVEAVDIAASTDGKILKAEKVRAQFDAQNAVDASATLELGGSQALQAAWSADMPNIERVANWISAANSPGLAAGWLRGSGTVSGTLTAWKTGDFTQTLADARLTATGLTWKSGRAESLSVDAGMEKGQVQLHNFSAILNERNKIAATGTATVATPWRFSGKVNGDLTQLADFEPWLRAFDVKGPLAGKASIAWEGSGQAEQFTLTGGAQISVNGFRMGEMKEPASLTLKTSHSGRRAEIATLDASMGDLKISAPGVVTENQLEIPAIKITAGKLAPVEGSVKVPLDFNQKGGMAGPVAMTVPLDVNLNVRDWDLAEVDRAAGLKSGAKGRINAGVKIAGTLQNPEADIALDLKGVTVPDPRKRIQPTDAEVKVNLRNRKLDATADIKQKPLQPLRATARADVDVQKLMENPASYKDIPVTADVTLPDSDLNAVRPFVDSLSSLSGKFGLNASVRGTLGTPRITGDFHANAPAISFKSEETPAIRNANVKIRFDGTRVYIEEAGAMMSGGTLGARGAVDWTKRDNPTVDVTLTAREALVMRNDSISMRANGDITCRGSLQQSTVAGRVELVRGRVFKEIEFLPLSLPNQLPPAPPPVTASSSGPPSLPAPFDKWIFNVDIVTREPVRLLGNVLNGGVVTNLKVTGTGAKIAMEGKASLKDARVRLPFSRLAISRGEVIFSRDKPFEPVLDLQGDSFVNGYQVLLNAYGSALDPKIRFSSSPPLPEGEIATLLATGSTSGDLKGSEGEAANRAAFLVISKLYRKLFRKGALAKEDDDPPRLSFSFSPLNSSGGNGRSFSAIYEINSHLQAVGAMSQRGTFRGLLYYLIRFR